MKKKMTEREFDKLDSKSLIQTGKGSTGAGSVETVDVRGSE
jgi:hypothetical protein